MEKLLEVKDLEVSFKTYAGEVKAVRGVNFDLYKGDTKVWSQPGIGNTGRYEMTIPTDVKPGDGYRFKISDSKNKDDVVYTGTFTIKRKIPLLLKAVPILVAGGAAVFLMKGEEATPEIGDAPCPGGGSECN